MVTCDTCGTEGQFRVVSGFYYCNVCDTQSQHAVEEEIELAFEEGDLFTQGRVVAGRTNKGGISKRFRAYRRLNLHNDLLRKQVDQLMHLGAPPKFKVAVMELWFKYIDVLELDCSPYGKLPPFCLHEEYVMATKKLKEESFSLKKAVYHHVPTRTETQRKMGKRWCESHPLYKYDAPKAPRMTRTGLSEIMSVLSTVDTDPSSSPARRSGARDLDESASSGAAECSGFGFGSLSTALFDTSGLERDSTSNVKKEEPMSEEQEDFGSFSFNVGSQEEPPPESAPTSAPKAAKGLLDSSQHIAGSMIEEIDLTSKVAYKLRAHMEERDVTRIEKYVENVLQMGCSSLVLVLYLALIRAKVNHIGVVDLYRFMRQGHVTYKEAREIASDELLKARINIFYNMHLPEIYPDNIGHGCFLKSCAVLCGLLNIEHLELPDLNFYVARISLDLNLPREIIAFATSIASSHSFQPKWSSEGHTEFPYLRIPSLPHIEVEACATILLTLKYLFGLDGLKEYEASKAAEQESSKGTEKYFVISHWLTQLSRRAHFLRRRGEFFNSHTLDFEHIKSCAHLIGLDAKRRDDFYGHGIRVGRCRQFLDDLQIPNKVTRLKISPSSFPMKSALEQLLKVENAGDPLRLLEDMTDLKVLHGALERRPYKKASRRQTKFYKERHQSFRSFASKDAADGCHLAPSENLLILMHLLSEYCLSSATMLNWALIRLETKVFGARR